MENQITENYRKLQIYVIKSPDFFLQIPIFIYHLTFLFIKILLTVLGAARKATLFDRVTLEQI